MSISLFYGALSGSDSAFTDRFKDVWEEELLMNIDEETWEYIWKY